MSFPRAKAAPFKNARENFKRATHQTPFFLWGVLKVKIEHVNMALRVCNHLVGARTYRLEKGGHRQESPGRGTEKEGRRTEHNIAIRSKRDNKDSLTYASSICAASV